MIDGPMINRFIEDSETFQTCANERFQSLHQIEGKVIESIAFDQEQEQNNVYPTVDLQKYKEELKAMMKVVAQGIGNTPVNVLVGEGSLLLKVLEFETARIIKEKDAEEEEKRKKKILSDREINTILNPKKILISRKPKKKSSLLDFCACSGKQFAENN